MGTNSRKEKALVPFFRPLTTFDVLDSLAGEIWDSWRPFSWEDRLLPGTDMFEEKGHLVMKTELPGIDKKDLEIILEGDTLTVKAEKKEEGKKGAAHKNGERHYEQYFHTVTLPYPVKEEGVTAKFEKGILEVRLPKGEEIKPRKIEVKAQLPKGETKKTEPKSTQKKG